MNPDSGVFTCPVGGTYMFMVHLATHKDKKALLSLRKNGMDIASIINQDGKNKGNHMMGQCVLMELDQGDEVRSSWSLETNSIIFSRFMSTHSLAPGPRTGPTYTSHSLLVVRII